MPHTERHGVGTLQGSLLFSRHKVQPSAMCTGRKQARMVEEKQNHDLGREAAAAEQQKEKTQNKIGNSTLGSTKK